jgi:hypothetical protein
MSVGCWKPRPAPAQVQGGAERCLWGRAARCRSGGIEGLRHRQQTHADPGRAGQGPQGPPRHALASAALSAARLVAAVPIAGLAVPRGAIHFSRSRRGWHSSRCHLRSNPHRHEPRCGRSRAQLAPPPIQLARVNARRSRQRRNTGARLKRGRYQLLLFGSAPPPSPLDRCARPPARARPARRS